MAFVGAVVGEAAALGGEGADEFGVYYGGGLEFAPEEGTPAALWWEGGR